MGKDTLPSSRMRMWAGFNSSWAVGQGTSVPRWIWPEAALSSFPFHRGLVTTWELASVRTSKRERVDTTEARVLLSGVRSDHSSLLPGEARR